jgi:tetratricopeptide (TPR) repeat protein
MLKAIKGFYYQVQLTVLRWLGLQADIVLFCECGEDIDHVKQLPDADGATQLRILEQIKTRDRITLRSQEALTALARFREAVVNNPTLQLLYRFSTTAMAGIEQGIQFPRSLGGIEAWNHVRKGTLAPDDVQEFVATFRDLIATASCPRDLPEALFLQLHQYIASTNPEALVEEFIKRFEWAIGLPDPSRLDTKITSLLLSQARAHIQEEAQQLADVLTVHVFKLLTQSGEKRLDSEGLERLLRERSLTEVDRRLLTRLENFIAQAEAYFPRLSSQIESLSHGVDALQGLPGQLSQLTQHVLGLQTQLLPLQLPPPDEPPLRPPIFARRRELVQTLLTILSEATWLNIMGATGMGKTYAAALLAETHERARVAWISLRGEQSGEGAVRQFDLHLLRLASSPDRPELVHAYGMGALPFSELVQHVALRLGAGSLLVIDELPDLLQVRQLGEKLVALMIALQASGGKLLTTAQRGLTAIIRERVDITVVESVIPAMTPQDIDEMLASTGAPSALRDPGFLALIHTVTHGHPSLILATIAFLQRNAWTINLERFISLFTGDPGREVREETRRKLLRLLPNDNVLELLYRISLIGVPFDLALVRAVAAVPPAISRPAELFPELMGSWVHRLAVDRYEVSPLLSDAGQVILEPKSQHHVHHAVALHHLQNQTIDLERGYQIILHLLAANDLFTLTFFLVQLVSQLNQKAQAEAFEFLTFFFVPLWPDELPLFLRILFRAVQIRLLSLLSKDAEAPIADLDTMIQQVDPLSLPAAFVAPLLIGPMNPAASPAMVAQRVLQACRLYAQLPAEMRVFSPEMPLISLVWVGIPHIQTRDDIRGILSVLADMDGEERRAAFSGEMIYEAPRMFVDQCLVLELKKAAHEQDWEGVLSLTDEILHIAHQPGGEPLRAPVARAKAIVLADHMERPQEALGILQEALTMDDNNTRFLLHYTAGCILLDHGTPEASLDRYLQALAESPTTYRFQHFDTLRRGSEAAGRLGQWQLMRDLAVKTLNPLKEEQLLYERLEMIGELAWAHWSLGMRVQACGAMAGLVRGLMQGQAFEDRRFREVFRKAQHVLGWMAAEIESGAPPRHTSDGEPYIEPYPGLFTRPQPQVAEHPLPSTSHMFLLGHLGSFAIGSGLYELASRTLSEAKRLAGFQNLVVFQHSIDWHLAELAAQKEDYETALSLAIPAIRSFPAGRHLRDRENSAFSS